MASSTLAVPKISTFCPFQLLEPRQNTATQSMASKFKLHLQTIDYSSDLSPDTTGPSSAASSPASEEGEEDDVIDNTLSYPEPNKAMAHYHRTAFLGTLPPSSLESTPAFLSKSYSHALSNRLTPALLSALMPPEQNSTPLFLHGPLTLPHVLARLLASDPRRALENAARMYPTRLLGYVSRGVQGADLPVLVSATEGKSKGMTSAVKGMLLFSSSIRERELVGRYKGPAAEERRGRASVVVDGGKGVGETEMDVLVWAWKGREDDPALEQREWCPAEWIRGDVGRLFDIWD